jgi:hypothetical protein
MRDGLTRRDMLGAAARAALVSASLPSAAAAEVPRAGGRALQVGPQRRLRRIGDAARVARDGDTIEVDAGDYRADVAVWDQPRLTIRAAGGRVRLHADGAAAESKAIWVARGARLDVEGFDFSGTRVPHRNGAGIRLESGHLRVVDCSFTDNENGILAGNRDDIVLEIERSEFGHNGAGDGQSHNLYAGLIAKLKVTASYFHHARVGHLLKSRARENFIYCNRLTDEGGSASYELEFPSGGIAYVVGNLIQQGEHTDNPHIVSVGIEGYAWPRNELYLVHNTLDDQRPGGGIALRVAPGADVVLAAHNLLVDGPGFPLVAGATFTGNIVVARDDVQQVGDYGLRLRKGHTPARRPMKPIIANGHELLPRQQYVHPRSLVDLPSAPTEPGALQQHAHGSHGAVPAVTPRPTHP